jgi:threonine/homoserine/homoserine lactone efflux protein
MPDRVRFWQGERAAAYPSSSGVPGQKDPCGPFFPNDPTRLETLWSTPAPEGTMTRTLILGSLLGFFSGVVPGPFKLLIAVTSLRHGFWAGLKIALVPLVSETLVLGLTAPLLAQLNNQTLRWMGIVGGIFIFLLGLRTLREAADQPDEEPQITARQRTLEGMMLSVLSPAPWVFWLLVGSPLFLGAYHQGLGHAAAFLGSFLFVFVGAYVGIAAAASLGHKKLPVHWYRRVMNVAAVLLCMAGVVLVWQSWIGNYHRMVRGSENIRNMVQDTVFR